MCGKKMATSQLLQYVKKYAAKNKACMHRETKSKTCVLAVAQQKFQGITGDSSVVVKICLVYDPMRREYQ